VDVTRTDDGYPKRTIATFDRYEDAQALVDRLADAAFPVEHLMIVGRDLKAVEKITGRLTWPRVLLSGLLGGAVLGSLFGLLWAAIFAHDGTSLLGIWAYWVGAGALFGLAVSATGHALSGGRRDFTSVSGIRATYYDVLADDFVTDEALARLLGPASRTGGEATPNR
jgi:hypothetical protein